MTGFIRSLDKSENCLRQIAYLFSCPHIRPYNDARCAVNMSIVERLISRPSQHSGRFETTTLDWLAAEKVLPPYDDIPWHSRLLVMGVHLGPFGVLLEGPPASSLACQSARLLPASLLPDVVPKHRPRPFMTATLKDIGGSCSDVPNIYMNDGDGGRSCKNVGKDDNSGDLCDKDYDGGSASRHCRNKNGACDNNSESDSETSDFFLGPANTCLDPNAPSVVSLGASSSDSCLALANASLDLNAPLVAPVDPGSADSPFGPANASLDPNAPSVASLNPGNLDCLFLFGPANAKMDSNAPSVARFDPGSSCQACLDRGCESAGVPDSKELFNKWSRCKVCSKPVVVFAEWRKLVCDQIDKDFLIELYVLATAKLCQFSLCDNHIAHLLSALYLVEATAPELRHRIDQFWENSQSTAALTTFIDDHKLWFHEVILFA